MKVRTSYVTNSSSSSFIVQKQNLTRKQIDDIKNHLFVAIDEMGWDFEEGDSGWTIDDKGNDMYGFLRGQTWMDNFDMYEFMEKIGVDMNKVEWDD